MIRDFMMSIQYIVIVVFLIIFDFFLLVYSMLLKLKKQEIIKRNRNRKRSGISFQEEVPTNHKRNCFLFWFVIVSVLIIISLLGHRRIKKGVKGEYSDALKKNVYNDEKIFSKEEIQETEKEKIDKGLHLDLEKTSKNNIETHKSEEETLEQKIENYQKKMEEIFSQIPFEGEASKIMKSEDMLDEEIEEKIKIFSRYVQAPSETLSEQECWEGYEAGTIVMEKNNTSENCFQTAVLAEAAYYKSCAAQRPASIREKYASGAVEYFEKFANYSVLYAGEDVIMEKCDVAFRIGKIIFQEKDYVADEDKEMYQHCLLLAYSYFCYARSEVDNMDVRYVENLYYEALCCIKVFEEIDTAYGIKLCRNVLKDWKMLETKKKYTAWKVEKKSSDDLRLVKERLEDIIN